MDFNYLLIWIISLSCIIFLIRAARSSLSNNLGWIVVCGSIVAVTLGMSYLTPAVAALIGSILWGIFFLLPRIGFFQVKQLVYQQRYGEARKLASRLRWLHPADGWLEQPKLLLALEMSQGGKIAEATKIIKCYEGATTTLARNAQALLYWMRADWEKCLLWIGENVPEKVLFKEHNLLVYYLRALGETGDLNGLLREIERAEHSLEKTEDEVKLNLVRMFALAFCGQTEQVWRLFDDPLAVYPKNTQRFWQATAQIAAGNEKVAREQLLALRQSKDLVLRNAIDWRLSQPPVEPERVLTDSSRQILYRIKLELKQEARYKNMINFSRRKAYATYGLIGLNLLFFALEIVSGGSENSYTLYRLGALVPQEVWSGQWWRLLSANFLHFGWLHLFTNMLGLYFLGQFVEFTLGIGRYLVAYLVSGVGSMLAFSILALSLGDQNQILVGASAAIMSLIGVIGAIFLRLWRQEKSRIAARRLRFLFLIIGLQFAFDLTTPRVSFLSHLFGLILGFFSGSFLLISWRSRN
ncbi:MAG: rhomboid family intramembrane serine protease [Xenococcaceae cyanobacterium]